MCIITKNPKQIATEDIICYKSLYGDLRATMYSFKYVLGTKYETTIKESNNWVVVDDEAVKILRDEIKNEAKAEDLGIRKNYIFNVINSYLHDFGFRCYGQGFHSFASLDRLNRSGLNNDNEVAYECIIPAGSEYIIDNNECIVSNQIIIKKQI